MERQKQSDVAVVIPTIVRPSLARAVRSAVEQDFPGTIQVLVGVDKSLGERAVLDLVGDMGGDGRDIVLFDPGYSTSTRHGGPHLAHDGGALRTILSYAANSRYVAYLDDDNWWAPDHLATLHEAIEGTDWAFSLRWFVDPETGEPLCVDEWESVGPAGGVYKKRFGGWVDPNCLMIDKLACEPALRLWTQPLAGDPSRMSADRRVFQFLVGHLAAKGTGRATSYYVIDPEDVNHPQRLKWFAEKRRAGA